MPADLDIFRAEAGFDIETLMPLYCELHEHQATGAPTVGGFAARTGPDAWERRRVHYREWLVQPTSFLLVAAGDNNVEGFAVVTVASGYDGWESPDKAGELKELVVTHSRRGQGIGVALVDRVESELRDAGIALCRLNVVAGNESAAAFYRHRGFEVSAQTFIKAL
jgi:GNAT superfamily N-acetyltransferase